MERQPKPSSVERLPFRTTLSEQRIIGDLLGIGGLREPGFAARVTTAAFLRSQLIDTAAVFIEWLRHELFPQEAQLRERRTELLREVNGGPLRVHFDQSLETATLTLQAKIRSNEEYQALLHRLKSFDFAAWQNHCDTERTDAD